MARKTNQALKTIFNAQAATGTGTVIDVSGFRNIMLQIGTDSSANLTLKIQGSLSETAPNFSTAASTSNHWDYVGCYDLDGASLVAGSTGFVVTGTDDFVNYLVNTEGFNWLCATVTARSAGSVTVKCKLYDND